jgi:tetraacyldisaccharide 4'-kinase
MSLDARLQRLWYGPAWRSLPLWPLALVYRAAIGLRGAAFRFGLLRASHPGVPVVVVGNITVGGTGKTPVAAWIAGQLQRRGHRVGVVLRGYGGRHRGAPRIVQLSDNPNDVGDEALLHRRHGAHVVVVSADRAAAAHLAREQGADVIVADDGLQHLRLARDVEVAVVDGTRGLGNRWMLPAGPLREPPSRLESVNALVITERDTPSSPALNVRGPLHITARFALGDAINITSGQRRSITDFAATRELHAVAGVGHPEAFFASLRAAGLAPATHALPDHGALVRDHLPFPATATVLMTEKDAVKCAHFAQPSWWWVELQVRVDRNDAAVLLGCVLERAGLTGAGAGLG